MLALVLASAPTFAQDEDLSAPPAQEEKRTMEANLRFRRLSVPQSLVDSWFYDKDEGSPFDRPKIGANVFGAEFVLRPHAANWIFYAEYMKNTTDEGYWDDVENGEPIDHDDGDWVRPDGLGAFAFGGTVQSEIRVTPDGATVGGAFLIGGGVGLAFVAGDLLTWHDGTDPDNAEPSCLPKSNSWERVDVCEVDGVKRMPRVLPVIDLTVSGKIDYKQMAHLRLDLGVHEFLYWGLAAGGAF
jgi:hypothetical protein